MIWDRRDQLRSVDPVTRECADNDSEHYHYGASGERLRKVRRSLAKSLTHAAEVRYLPGLEIRNDTATGEHLETLVLQVGTASVRILHWQSGRPSAIANDQVRYNLANHLGSATLELDGSAQLISHEHYYPFGGTCWWAGRNHVEAGYKTVRYSGQERDASGLYYYGARYYAPWLQRWICPDPEGTADGLNFFSFVRNRPLNRVDVGGFNGEDIHEEQALANSRHYRLVAQGLDAFPEVERNKVESSLALGIEWLDSALEVFESPDNDSLAYADFMLKAFFGTQPSDERTPMVAELVEALGGIKGYMAGLISTQRRHLSLADIPHANTAGVTQKLNSLGKVIWLSNIHVRESADIAIAATLVHESAHALTPGTAASAIKDFWYLTPFPPKHDATFDELKDYQVSILNNSQVRAQAAPDEKEMLPDHQRGYRNLVNQVLRSQGAPSAIGLTQREDAYRTNAMVRRQVVLKNADSFAALAMQFHRF